MIKSVVIADDSEAIQKSLAITFEPYTLEIKAVDSFVKALRQVTKQQPDLIIADAGLTGTNGPDHFRQLQEKAQGAPILILEGSYESINKSAYEAKGFHILKKPFDSQTLTDLLTNTMGLALEIKAQSTQDIHTKAANLGLPPIPPARVTPPLPLQHSQTKVKTAQLPPLPGQISENIPTPPAETRKPVNIPIPPAETRKPVDIPTPPAERGSREKVNIPSPPLPLKHQYQSTKTTKFSDLDYPVETPPSPTQEKPTLQISHSNIQRAFGEDEDADDLIPPLPEVEREHPEANFSLSEKLSESEANFSLSEKLSESEQTPQFPDSLSSNISTAIHHMAAEMAQEKQDKKDENHSQLTKDLIQQIMPSIQLEVERQVRVIVEDYCDKQLRPLAKDIITSELRRLAQEKTRHFLDNES